MHYYISFVVLARRSNATLMQGPPEFDVQAEFNKFKDCIIEKLGPEPSLLEPNSTWALRALKVLVEFQKEYHCTGDFEAIFIEHLAQRCGFHVVNHVDCRLG